MKLHSLLLTLALVIGGLWYLITTHKAARATAPPDEHLAMVKDNSTSQNTDCAALPALVKETLSGMHIGKHSRLAFFTLGSPQSSWEPVMALDGPAPRKGGSMFSGDALSKLEHACASAPQVPGSSIFRAVAVSLDHLHGEGCGQALPCTLLVQSDAEENVTRRFYHAAPGGAGKAATAPPLNNEGVRVLWCGYASTEGGGDPRGDATDALIAKWRASFTNTAAVTFRPFCGAAGASQGSAPRQ
jgi:hypothetical protein